MSVKYVDSYKKECTELNVQEYLIDKYGLLNPETSFYLACYYRIDDVLSIPKETVKRILHINEDLETGHENIGILTGLNPESLKFVHVEGKEDFINMYEVFFDRDEYDGDGIDQKICLYTGNLIRKIAEVYKKNGGSDFDLTKKIQTIDIVQSDVDYSLLPRFDIFVYADVW